ncbi:reverse transcriptase-like protein [Natrarchaeobius halalkaliphilus]|uniref:Reverse transcriptase-like protein n=1 Tax=Natrarchaeobius halalkaliphilus TaxID=1679091 RepID=A0A3N6P210_9EURY|nr:ribonuclease HI [Natrarchaeobius halalkaliphilus]RQG91599.1 reverse transcriptase-like protein [Natrarchaeobius halalkaliphilus]
MPVIECDVDAARDRLENAGVEIDAGNTDHERWRATRGDATAVAYDDKIVIQGGNPRDLEAVLRDGGGRAHVYFDGAARGNPGPAAIGWVIVTGDGIVGEGNDRIGRATNNQAEYEALIAALEAARDYGYDEIHVRGDSELVVKQVRGEYDTNNPELRERRVSVHELLSAFDEWTLEYVPREVNGRADGLANEALDQN